MIKVLKNSKPIWQITLAVLMLLMSIYFIKNEHLEIAQISHTLNQIDDFYLYLGLFVTVVYVFAQAFMYVMSFRSVGQKVSIRDALPLYLKRNLISVFLPAGGFSSLIFFTKPLTKKGISTTDIYYGSYIYGFVGLLSVVVVSIPLFIVLFLKNRDTYSRGSGHNLAIPFL